MPDTPAALCYHYRRTATGTALWDGASPVWGVKCLDCPAEVSAPYGQTLPDFPGPLPVATPQEPTHA